MKVDEILSGAFALGEHIRYVAVADGPDVLLQERSGLSDASSSDSDRYEELLVNPTLLLLTRQRGEIDCGGLRYVIVRYGNFAQVVVPNPASNCRVVVKLRKLPPPRSLTRSVVLMGKVR